MAEKLIEREKNLEKKTEIAIKETDFLTEISQKVNAILSENFPNLNDFLADLFESGYLVWIRNKVVVFGFLKNKEFI